jgi:predicted nuclease of predicted toxin-antitoxin system
MNILLDECTPRVVKKRLPGRSVQTVQEMGWSGLRNGELLAAAEGRFNVFITTDKNLRNQQNLTGRKFAVLLLPSNQVPIVEALIPSIEPALAIVQAGDFIEIPLPPK